MKKAIALFLALAFGTLCFAGDKMIFSTTIDFLDYAFTYGGPEGYYPLEEYERVIKKLADDGVSKLYLRVNTCGTTHYPTEVSAMYGTNNAFHWNDTAASKRLIATYSHYNPCLETIRLGHKYGVEVWAWESLFDDAGVKYGTQGVTEEYKGIYDKLDGWALLDPFYVDNLDAFAMRNPKSLPQLDKVEAINKEAYRLPIARIVIVNAENRSGLPPSRVKTPADLIIKVSDDNRNYTDYNGPFEIINSVTADNRNRFEITGLNITSKYIQLLPQGMPSDKNFSLVLSKERGQAEIYNTDGELVHSVWGVNDAGGEALRFNFSAQSAYAWDYGKRCIGCKVGEMEALLTDLYQYGVAEFNVPKAMKHKVDRFIELARYNFDGFIFNTRCHSARGNAEQFGFNPEVMAKFAVRYGHEYNDTQEDLTRLFQLRAEGIAEFFKNCKAESNGRPIYLSGPMPLELKDRKGYNKAFGPLPWLYKQYFADGSIDGIIMIGPNFQNGPDFSDYFTDDITGGKDIKIGMFREMLNCQQDYDMKADIDACRASGLDEMELYESEVLSLTQWMHDLLHDNIKDWSIEKYQFGWSRWH